MVSSSSQTSLSDIHPHIIQTHILPRLDGRSLSATATASSYLQTLCADQNLWSDLCKSTWPSITHPRLHDVITTFPAGHRSFFHDSFPSLIPHVKPDCPSSHPNGSFHPLPAEVISAVDIRYQNDVVFSRVQFTNTTADFLSSPLRIELKDDQAIKRSDSQPVPGISPSIDLKVDEFIDADDTTISYLKESVTLNWILIDPTRKRAVNLSSIKPVLAWIATDIHLRYVTVLPGRNPNEVVECRIEVTLVAGKHGLGLQVLEVTLHIQDMACNLLTGRDFLVITSRVILEKNNITREVEDGDKKKEENNYNLGIYKTWVVIFLLGRTFR